MTFSCRRPKYSAALQPLTFAPNGKPSGYDGTDHWTLLEFTYHRPAAALTELSYQTEAAASPAGPWSTTGITDTILTDDGVTQTVKSTVSAGPAAHSLRLRVTRR